MVEESHKAAPAAAAAVEVLYVNHGLDVSQDRNWKGVFISSSSPLKEEGGLGSSGRGQCPARACVHVYVNCTSLTSFAAEVTAWKVLARSNVRDQFEEPVSLQLAA